MVSSFDCVSRLGSTAPSTRTRCKTWFGTPRSPQAGRATSGSSSSGGRRRNSPPHSRLFTLWHLWLLGCLSVARVFFAACNFVISAACNSPGQSKSAACNFVISLSWQPQPRLGQIDRTYFVESVCRSVGGLAARRGSVPFFSFGDGLHSREFVLHWAKVRPAVCNRASFELP